MLKLGWPNHSIDLLGFVILKFDFENFEFTIPNFDSNSIEIVLVN